MTLVATYLNGNNKPITAKQKKTSWVIKLLLFLTDDP